MLVTKDDLKEALKDTASKSDINEILTAIDSFAKKVDNVEMEQASNISAHDRFEKRISGIENNLNLNSAS